MPTEIDSVRAPLSALSPEQLAARLDIGVDLLLTAAGKLNALHERVPADARLELLLRITERPDIRDLGEGLGRAVLELGPVESLAQLGGIRGIGPARLRLLAETLAAADLDALLKPAPPTSAGTKPSSVPQPMEPPDVADAFLASLSGMLDHAEDVYLELAEQRGTPAALIQATLGTFDGLHAQVRAVRAQVAATPAAAQAIAPVVAETNAIAVANAAMSSLDATPLGEKLRKAGEGAETIGDGLSLLQGVLEKIAEANPALGAVISGLKNIADISKYIADRIKEKADPIEQVQADLTKLEAKTATFIEELTGNSPYADKPGGELIDPPIGRARAPKLPGSLAWVVRDLETKLHWLKLRIDGDPDYRRASPDAPIAEPDENDTTGPNLLDLLGNTERRLLEFERVIKFKIDKLADLLGRTLVSSDAIWDPEPPDDTPRTVSREDMARVNKTPEHAIKEELHGIEDSLKVIIDLLDPTKQPPEEPPGDPEPPEDPPEQPPPLELPTDLKRIFVWEQGVFEPSSPGEARTIEVRTAAFDLGGWIDLGDLDDGDVVVVSLYVHLPAASGATARRLYKSRTWTGRSDAGLKNLTDVVGGLWLVGNAVDIEIRLISGSLAIPFQFVVESQARP